MDNIKLKLINETNLSNNIINYYIDLDDDGLQKLNTMDNLSLTRLISDDTANNIIPSLDVNNNEDIDVNNINVSYLITFPTIQKLKDFERKFPDVTKTKIETPKSFDLLFSTDLNTALKIGEKFRNDVKINFDLQFIIETDNIRLINDLPYTSLEQIGGSNKNKNNLFSLNLINYHKGNQKLKYISKKLNNLFTKFSLKVKYFDIIMNSKKKKFSLNSNTKSKTKKKNLNQRAGSSRYIATFLSPEPNYLEGAFKIAKKMSNSGIELNQVSLIPPSDVDVSEFQTQLKEKQNQLQDINNSRKDLKIAGEDVIQEAKAIQTAQETASTEAEKELKKINISPPKIKASELEDLKDGDNLDQSISNALSHFGFDLGNMGGGALKIQHIGGGYNRDIFVLNMKDIQNNNPESLLLYFNDLKEYNEKKENSTIYKSFSKNQKFSSVPSDKKDKIINLILTKHYEFLNKSEISNILSQYEENKAKKITEAVSKVRKEVKAKKPVRPTGQRPKRRRPSASKPSIEVNQSSTEVNQSEAVESNAVESEAAVNQPEADKLVKQTTYEDFALGIGSIKYKTGEFILANDNNNELRKILEKDHKITADEYKITKIEIEGQDPQRTLEDLYNYQKEPKEEELIKPEILNYENDFGEDIYQKNVTITFEKKEPSTSMGVKPVVSETAGVVDSTDAQAEAEAKSLEEQAKRLAEEEAEKQRLAEEAKRLKDEEAKKVAELKGKISQNRSGLTTKFKPYFVINFDPNINDISDKEQLEEILEEETISELKDNLNNLEIILKFINENKDYYVNKIQGPIDFDVFSSLVEGTDPFSNEDERNLISNLNNNEDITKANNINKIIANIEQIASNIKLDSIKEKITNFLQNPYEKGSIDTKNGFTSVKLAKLNLTPEEEGKIEKLKQIFGDTPIGRIFVKLNKFKDILKENNFKDEDNPEQKAIDNIQETLNKGVENAENNPIFNFKEISDYVNNIDSNITFALPELGGDTEANISTQIRDLTEEIMGACRVIVKYRDGGGTDGDKVVRKHNSEDYKFNYAKMEGRDSGTCETINPNLFGPFSGIYDENDTTDVIFEETFMNDNLLDSVYGKSLIMFGFGFSGSGKTYQLISPDNTKINSKGEEKENHLLALCLQELNKKTVSNIELEISELYPRIKNIKQVEKEINFNPYLNTIDQLGYLPSSTSGENNFPKFQVGENSVINYLDQFNKYNEYVTRVRTNRFRITPTPNNPESSRSHIFYKFNITFDGNKKGSIVIVDMAGTENTIEIKKNFLNINETDYNDISKRRVTYSENKSNKVTPKYPKYTCYLLGIPVGVGDSHKSDKSITPISVLFSYGKEWESEKTMSFFNLNLNGAKKNSINGVKKHIKKEEKGYGLGDQFSDTQQRLVSIEVLNNQINDMFASISRLIYNKNPEDELTNQEIIRFNVFNTAGSLDQNNVDLLKILDEKVEYFYDRIYKNCIEIKKDQAENTYMGIPVSQLKNNQYIIKDIIDTMNNEILTEKSNTIANTPPNEITNLLHWLNYTNDTDNDFVTKDNILDIIEKGYYVNLKHIDLFNTFYEKNTAKDGTPTEIVESNMILESIIKKKFGKLKETNKDLEGVYKNNRIKYDAKPGDIDYGNMNPEQRLIAQDEAKEKKKAKIKKDADIFFNFLKQEINKEKWNDLYLPIVSDNKKNQAKNFQSLSPGNLKIFDDLVCQHKEKINYNNPIQIYIVLIMKYYSKNLSGRLSKANGPADFQSYALLNGCICFFRIVLYSFMVKYMDLVVTQGQGITATLEHLKYFFLNKSIADKDTQLPTALIKYDSNPINAGGDNSPFIGGRKMGIKDPDIDPLEGDWHYVNEDKSVGLKENVQRGFMTQFRTLEILTDLAGGNSKKDLFLNNDKTAYVPNSNNTPRLQTTTGSKFLMLAAIKRNSAGNDKEEQQKLCKATENTLMLAENLASEPTPQDEEMQKIKASNKPSAGGSRKTKKTKLRTRIKYTFIKKKTKRRKPRRASRKSKNRRSKSSK